MKFSRILFIPPLWLCLFILFLVVYSTEKKAKVNSCMIVYKLEWEVDVFIVPLIDIHIDT